MRQHAICVIFFLATIGLWVPLESQAQSTAQTNRCTAPGYMLDVRPNPSGQATVVIFGLRVLDVLEINDVDQTISLDMAVRMRWTDPRLAAWAGCKLSIRDVWFPELTLINSGRMFQRWPDTVSVERGGQVTYQQRVSGTFASYHQLADFPFNSQTISFWVYPLEWSAPKVVFRIDKNFTGISSLLNISDWQITGVEPALTEVDLDAFDEPRSGYVLQISAKRYTSYYIYKIMIPIALIVVMSWSVFWINPKEFGTQIGLSATSVLTMIAFIFATTNMLPRLGYFTLLDSYIAGATVFVFIALLQSLVTGYLATTGRVAIAMRLDRYSRVVFPLAVLGLCALLYTKVG